MADEPHDAVKLLLARMESHPEEFRFKEGAYHDRWYNHISAINSYGNEADKSAIAAKTRDIRMAEVHEQIMDELLNGEDRRRKEEEEADYERKVLIAAAQKAHRNTTSTLQQSQQKPQQNAYVQGLTTISQLEPTLSTSAIEQIRKALKL